MRLNKRPEEQLQFRLCQYLKMYYPNVFFNSDPSGLRVTKGIRYLLQQTRSNHAHIDLTLLKRGYGHLSYYHGLILELKSETPYLRDGITLSSNEHIQDQYKSMLLLMEEGFKCDFCWEYDQGVRFFNEYLGPPQIDNEPLF